MVIMTERIQKLFTEIIQNLNEKERSELVNMVLIYNSSGHLKDTNINLLCEIIAGKSGSSNKSSSGSSMGDNKIEYSKSSKTRENSSSASGGKSEGKSLDSKSGTKSSSSKSNEEFKKNNKLDWKLNKISDKEKNDIYEDYMKHTKLKDIKNKYNVSRYIVKRIVADVQAVKS